MSLSLQACTYQADHLGRYRLPFLPDVRLSAQRTSDEKKESDLGHLWIAIPISGRHSVTRQFQKQASSIPTAKVTALAAV